MKNQHEYTAEHFKELDWSDKIIEVTSFDNCTFSSCNFSNSTFHKCKFHECHFIHCNLSLIKVTKCSFFDTYFEGSKIIGVNWTNANWPTITLSCPLRFNQCILNDCSFMSLSLREMSMIDCKAHDVDFRDADLTQADFSQSDFTNSLFNQTLLAEANFTDAINYNINVFENNVKRAKFSLPEAMSLLQYLDIELVD
ncbi:MAG: pentapeptide repeat-containing protein [Candidatus Berkiella sp.]